MYQTTSLERTGWTMAMAWSITLPSTSSTTARSQLVNHDPSAMTPLPVHLEVSHIMAIKV